MHFLPFSILKNVYHSGAKGLWDTKPFPLQGPYITQELPLLWQLPHRFRHVLMLLICPWSLPAPWATYSSTIVSSSSAFQLTLRSPEAASFFSDCVPGCHRCSWNNSRTFWSLAIYSQEGTSFPLASLPELCLLLD